MHEILDTLPPDSRVLDLGSGGGSFAAGKLRVVRLDLAPPRKPPGEPFVLARAENLPFRDATFAAVIANHSLEHIDELPRALHETARVLKPGGAFFASVPDAAAFTDRLYRWLAEGGGHVNAFADLRKTAQQIERLTGIPFAGSRLLYSSLSCLNRKNAVSRRPRKLLLLGGGSEGSLRTYVLLSRPLDRLLGTRFSVYGWALYFGSIPRPIETDAWANVCVRCGSGSPSRRLIDRLFRRWIFLKAYLCPHCDTPNFFVHDPPIRRQDRLQSLSGS